MVSSSITITRYGLSSLTKTINHNIDKHNYRLIKIWYTRSWRPLFYAYHAEMRPTGSCKFDIGPISVREKSKNPRSSKMVLILTDMQQIEFKLSPVNGAGNPAPVDGTPEWTLSDSSVGALIVAEGGLTATFVTNGKLGATQVNVTADARIGDGTSTIVSVLDVTVAASEAISLGISSGVPTNKV